MESLDIRACTVQDILDSPNLDALLDEYGAESAMHELGPPHAQVETYRAMEDNGALHVIGAWRDGSLIGFLFMLAAELPHFGKFIASTESFFVSASARKTGAGMKLLHAAEDIARALGAIGFFVSAPTGGRLEKVLPSIGYRDASSVFYRGLQ